MIYFYLWVLFLLSITLAVPIVSYIEKSRARKALGVQSPAGPADPDVAAFDEVAVEDAAVVPDDGMGGFGDAKSGDGVDDFSAFEDFK